VNEITDPETALTQLSKTIDQLTELCLRLSRENQQLKAKQAALKADQEHYISQTRGAREKVATMLDRLQSLNQKS